MFFLSGGLLKAQVTADFSGTPLTGCAPLVVNFTDISTGNPTQWKWELGNGTTSFLQNPATTYFNAGSYTVTLIVQDANGDIDTIVKPNFITVYALPTIQFIGAPRQGCAPLNTQFTDQSLSGSGVITNWLWDFGDGTTGNTQNPTHPYTSLGNFNVTLQVTNSFGCSKTLTKTQYVQVTTGVDAQFTNTQPTNCQPPANIQFTNLSTGPGTLSYQWNFGDGGTSTLANPSHTYTAIGSYTVTLIVVNNTGCTDTLVVPDAVIINQLTPGFNRPDSVCVNEFAMFTNTTVPTPASVFWDFGDGTNAIAQSQAKAYATPGTYQVKMIATLGTCIDSITRPITVVAKPVVSFSAPVVNACKPPLTVNFQNTSTGGISWFWDFGDGGTSSLQNPSHTYTSYGDFTVKLVVTNSTGCKDSLSIPNYIHIQPPAASINGIPRGGCSPLTHVFSASVVTVDPIVTYLWNFGDGNTSSLPNPPHTYTAGTYDISLIVTTASGCADTVLVPAGIRVGNKPTVNFGATPLITCARENVQFTDSSFSNIDRWYWEFGDGGTSTDQNPLHHYADTGFFTVKLIVWSNGCADSVSFSNYIYIKPPIAKFTISNICDTTRTIQLFDESIGADEWYWSFGNGDSSYVPNPYYTFPDTGYYTIKLRVVNQITGCDDTTAAQIRIIDEWAQFTATDTILCKNTITSFSATENSPGAIASYSWDFGDGNTGTGKNTSHTYTTSGFYDVTLIITDIFGCKDTLIKTNYIRVDGPTAAFTAPGAGSCLLSTVTFTDQSVSDGLHPITTWIWNFGDGTIDTLTAPPFSHDYQATGTYNITLTTIDNKGCRDVTTTNTSLIISKPAAHLSTNDTLVCPNTPVQFINASIGNGLTYLWEFGDGSTDTTLHPIHLFAAEGAYDIKLTVTDIYGCIDSISWPQLVRVQAARAQFVMSDSLSTCPPLLVSFTNTSPYSNQAVHWDFGDGSSSTNPNPLHIYNNPGIFNVKLRVTGPNGLCQDSMIRTITVRGPIGSFTYGPLNGCSPLTVNLDATSPDRVSYIWDYNDGNILSTADSTVSHIYTRPGAYLPRMILVDSGGCQVPILGPDSIYVRGVVSNFGFTGQTFCDSAIVHFTDSSYSNDGFTSWFWNFGDGNTSTLQNPSHNYTAPGQYFPSLLVTTNSGCTDTTQLPVPVRIVGSPQADIVKSPDGCSPVTVTFSGILTLPDTSIINWQWDLGNGVSSSQQNPPAQIYTTPQVYNISLIATNSSGCKDTVYKTVEAFPIPQIDAGTSQQICQGNSYNLSATGGNAYNWSPSNGLSCTNCGNPVANPTQTIQYTVTGTSVHGCSSFDTVGIQVIQPFVMQSDPGDTLCIGKSTRLFALGASTYEWSPATGLNSTTVSAPTASPRTTTTYRVVGRDAFGCFSDTGYATVRVYPIPTVDAGPDVTLKNGQSTTLTPVLSGDVTSHYWMNAPSIISRNGRSITVLPKETTEYKIEVKNDGGCKAVDQVLVHVLCDGDNIFIPNTFSPNGDGSNDVFYPRGNGLFSIKTFRIFNRWGELMFEKANFNPNDVKSGWDGTFKGKQLNSDVYVYTAEVVCENSTVMVLKGNIALLR